MLRPLVENAERYQSLSKMTYKNHILCDNHVEAVGEENSVPSAWLQTARWAGQTSSLIFAGPTWPWPPYAGIPDSDRWGSVWRCGGGGGGCGGWVGESQRGTAATPGRKSDSLASACCQSAPATPGPGAGLVSTHFHTWTNSWTGQEKQPTHSYLSPCPPSSFLPSKNTLTGSSDPVPIFSCPRLVPFTGPQKICLLNYSSSA